MTLNDAGPIVALIDDSDSNHLACLQAGSRLPAAPLITTFPCFTEAMYLLHRRGGFAAQEKLWNMVRQQRLILLELTEQDLLAMADLMAKYQDCPMDLADASLVVAAEKLKAARVFTVDSDCHVYRLADGTALEVIP